VAHARQLALGVYGMVPSWSKDLSISKRTYNARSETVTATLCSLTGLSNLHTATWLLQSLMAISR
jgi:hypothetical protein